VDQAYECIMHTPVPDCNLPVVFQPSKESLHVVTNSMVGLPVQEPRSAGLLLPVGQVKYPRPNLLIAEAESVEGHPVLGIGVDRAWPIPGPATRLYRDGLHEGDESLPLVDPRRAYRVSYRQRTFRYHRMDLRALHPRIAIKTNKSSPFLQVSCRDQRRARLSPRRPSSTSSRRRCP
jgi:hypothetical protein